MLEMRKQKQDNSIDLHKVTCIAKLVQPINTINIVHRAQTNEVYKMWKNGIKM